MYAGKAYHQIKTHSKIFKSMKELSAKKEKSMQEYLKHRWKTQGPRAVFHHQPCFNWLGTLFLPGSCTELLSPIVRSSYIYTTITLHSALWRQLMWPLVKMSLTTLTYKIFLETIILNGEILEALPVNEKDNSNQCYLSCYYSTLSWKCSA